MARKLPRPARPPVQQKTPPPTPQPAGIVREPPLVPTDLRRQITPFPSMVRPSWSINQIRSAVLAMRLGVFQQASLLADVILDDDEIPGAVARRINATLRSEFFLRPESTEDRELTKREKKIEASWCDMIPDAEMYDFFVSYLFMGVAVGTIDWDTSTPLWTPHFRALPTEFLTYQFATRTWYYQSLEGYQPIVPGDGKWVLWQAGRRPWNYGLLRPLAPIWYRKQQINADWDRYNQKHGLPIIKAKVPVFGEEKEKNQFIDDLDRIQAEGIVGLPQDENGVGYDVEFLETSDQAWETFQAKLEREDRKVQILLTGGNLQTEVASSGGNRAASETHSDALKKLAQTDSKRLGEVLAEQFLDPFMRLNFGVADAELYPHWDVAPEDDMRTWSQAHLQFGQALVQFKTAGYKVGNLDEVGREYGLEFEEAPEPMGATGVTGGTGATGGTGQ